MSELFLNVALIECVDATALAEVLAAGLECYVVERLSETTVMVDHERLGEITRLLRRQGQTPKITQE